MKIVGLNLVSGFLEAGCGSGDAEMVRAWICEIRQRTWQHPEALARDFRNVSFAEPHLATFRLAAAPIAIEAVIDFRSGVVLVTNIKSTVDEIVDTASRNGIM